MGFVIVIPYTRTVIRCADDDTGLIYNPVTRGFGRIYSTVFLIMLSRTG